MHLSPDQLSSWAFGEQSIEMLEHVASCDQCRTQVDQFDETLAHFRSAIHRRAANPGCSRLSGGTRFHPWPIAVGCVVLLLLLFVSRPQVPQHQDDDALLTQISQEVSQTVPAAMEPLSSLVSGADERTMGGVAETTR
jgi:hypothetical protein